MNIIETTKAQLKEEIIRAIVALQWLEASHIPEFILEIPRDKSHGDYATNIAMQLSRMIRQNPKVIAEQLIAQINSDKAQLASVEVAGPGFLNFKMNKSYLYPILHEIYQQAHRFGEVKLGHGQKINVEFVSANPTGSLHLGHARGAAVGDVICNILDFAGYEVTREYYINDAGNQINNLAKSIEARYMQLWGHPHDMPEDGYHGSDIKHFAEELVQQYGEKFIAVSSEERLVFFRSYGLEKELDKIKRDLTRFGVHFDVFFSETSIYEDHLIPGVLQQLRQLGHIYEEEGATWLKTTPWGDDKDRVLIKNDGTFTYLTPDIAYHCNKFQRGYHRLVNIWGADHHGYIPRMKAAIQALGYDPSQLTVLVAQMVSLYQNGEKVKMSKRTGKAVTMEDLMDEVGVDAIRYFFTMRSVDSHLDFDMDLALAQSNENPVFYVQYAHARMCSIFRQAEEQGISTPQLADIDLHCLDRETEWDLLQKMGEFPVEIALAAEHYAPHRIIRYVYELASQFHSYYRAERVITDDVPRTLARLALLHGLRTTLANALRIVGVTAPEQM